MRSFLKSIICVLSMVSTMAFSKVNTDPLETVVLTEKNHAVLRGEVNEASVSKVQQFLITSPEKEVYIYIDSPGGSILDGLNLIETMESSGKKITCIANTAASMAFIILESCTTRAVTKSALVMQHVASYGLRGQEPNNYTFAHLIHRLQAELEERQAERIGMDVETFRVHTHSDWWLFGSESVEAGVADKTMRASCAPELAGETYTEKIQTLFWSFTVTWSKCPLLGTPLAVVQNRVVIGNDDIAQRELIEVLKIFNVREVVKQWKETGDNPRERYNNVRSLPY